MKQDHHQQFAAIAKEVQAYVRQQSWWQLHGIESVKMLGRLGIFLLGGAYYLLTCSFFNCSAYLLWLMVLLVSLLAVFTNQAIEHLQNPNG